MPQVPETRSRPSHRPREPIDIPSQPISGEGYPSIILHEYQYSNFNKTLSIANIKRFTREDKYKFLFVEYVTEAIYGFNLCVKVEQTAAINIVKDTTDFTVEG